MADTDKVRNIKINRERVAFLEILFYNIDQNGLSCTSIAKKLEEAEGSPLLYHHQQ